ncbi:MAG: hypothetical protein JSS81_21480 [Acidobacteria bacterium]|nr:hypothetical protein [Acidobacteriota bacterium]
MFQKYKIRSVIGFLVVAFLSLFFIRADFQFLGGSDLLRYLLGVRIVFVIISIICLAMIWRTHSETFFDRLLVGWTLIGVTVKTIISLTRPPDYAYDFPLDVLLLLFLFTLTPLPFQGQILTGTFFFGQSVVMLFFFKQIPPLGVQVILTCLILSYLLGIAISWYFNYQRRFEYDFLCTEIELRQKLQAAVDELKVLKGSLPICSNCKKIRDEEHHWHPIEKYISDRSEAEFSHGICPDCVKNLYPEIADRILS